jgi:hypothetical protein
MTKDKTEPIEITCCWNCRNQRLVTIQKAATECSVSVNTIYVWMKRGAIEWVYNAGGKRRIYWDSLVKRGLVSRTAASGVRKEAV